MELHFIVCKTYGDSRRRITISNGAEIFGDLRMKERQWEDFKIILGGGAVNNPHIRVVIDEPAD